ncbi:hypothetical protein EDB86DRAFT_2829234 [Lactarius hatsudake]|nr:hypothetical protein EDB86DRAFT_2829234 [Lactarius hatsudake]
MSWGLVVAALHAMLRQCGRLVGSYTMWWGLGVCWQGGGESAGSGVLHTVLGWGGSQWWLSLACRVEAAWQQGVASYWGSVVAGWWSGCCVPCWGSGGMVLRVMLGWHAGGRLEMTRMLKVAAIACNVQAVVLQAMLGQQWQGVASYVGAACWGGVIGDDSRAHGGGNSLQHSGWMGEKKKKKEKAHILFMVLQAMSGRCVGAGTSGGGSGGLRAQGDSNGLQH